MYTVDDFDWGEFVRCNGRIMFIQDAAGDDHPGMLGLQTEELRRFMIMTGVLFFRK